jgi:hypothetical protein
MRHRQNGQWQISKLLPFGINRKEMGTWEGQKMISAKSWAAENVEICNMSR